MIFSVSSSAALRPTSGLAPAPSPLVSLAPICSLTGRLRQLQRLQIGVGGDEFDALDLGANHAVDGVGSAAAHADHLDLRAFLTFFAERNPNPRFFWRHRVPPQYCRLGPAFDRSLAGEHAFQFCYQCSGTLRRRAASVRPVQQQPYCGCVLGLGKLFRHTFEAARRGHAHGQRKHVLGQFDQAAAVARRRRTAPGRRGSACRGRRA